MLGVRPLEGLVHHRVERRIQKAGGKAGGRVVAAGGLALAASGLSQREGGGVQIEAGVKLEQSLIDAVQLFRAQVAVYIAPRTS